MLIDGIIDRRNQIGLVDTALGWLWVVFMQALITGTAGGFCVPGLVVYPSHR